MNQPDIEAIAAILQQRLVASWAEAIDAIRAAWEELEARHQLTPVRAQQAVAQVLGQWPEITAAQYADIIDRIFYGGFIAGVADAALGQPGWGPDLGDANVIEWLKANPHGFIPALRNMGEDGVRRIERILDDAYQGHDAQGVERHFDLDELVRRVEDEVGVGKNRAELILRTETAKATALGRIYAWEKDPERDWYDYHWIATPDERTKDVSLLFEAAGPYSFDEIKRRWIHDHNHPVWVRNRHTGRWEWQTSAFNCRCTVARTPKDPIKLRDEGKITQAQYERMA